MKKSPVFVSPTLLVCGVSCHKDCCSRLAVECRKRTKSVSFDSNVPRISRSFSLPLSTRQNTKPECAGKPHTCLN